MLLKQDFFAGFLAEGSTPHLGSNAKEVLNCLTASSTEEVDDLVAKAQASGGSVYLPAKESMPGMYGASIADPDGHVWELLWMSQEAVAGHEHKEAETAQA
jgi:predicted lactoylglutathione lyase